MDRDRRVSSFPYGPVIVAALVVTALAVAVHVNVWRYDLLTRRKLFQAESARRRRS